MGSVLRLEQGVASVKCEQGWVMVMQEEEDTRVVQEQEEMIMMTTEVLLHCDQGRWIGSNPRCTGNNKLSSVNCNMSGTQWQLL